MAGVVGQERDKNGAPIPPNSGTYPNSHILFDDNFSNGFCGWEPLYAFESTTQTNWWTGTSPQHVLPLSLSNRGTSGSHAVLLTTANIKTPNYGSTATAIKRTSHQYVNANRSGRIRFDIWFTFGADSSTISGFSGSAAPRYLLFGLDTMYPTSTTIANNTGKRSFFKARWRQSTYNAGTYTYDGSWSVTAGTGLPVTDGSYVSPESNFVSTGYYSDWMFNQNKLNTQFFSLTVDASSGRYVEMQTNGLVYNLQRCPGISNGAPVSLLQPDDTSYNVFEFNGGLNAYVEVQNLAEGNPTASRLEIHRAVVRYA
jgi:hypothetical protein